VATEPRFGRPIPHLPTPRRRPSVATVLRRRAFPVIAGMTPRGTGPNPYAKKAGADFDTEWARRPLARRFRVGLHGTVGRAVIEYYGQPTITGTDRLAGAEDEALIFASNHHSHADTALLLSVIPDPWRERLVVAAAADYFFPNRVAGFVAALGIGAIPIERTRLSRRAVELPIQLVSEGWSFVLYPEGGRSKDGWAKEFRPGVSFVAKMTGARVVPVYIEGTDRVLGPGSRWPTRAPVAIAFGAPLSLAEEEDLRDFTARVDGAVAALADEQLTDWWSARRRAHAGTTPPLQGPDAPSWRRTWALNARRPRRQRRTWPRL
jgi:1-acyl-sn-glycerol-3-phosphate acyltransferase